MAEMIVDGWGTGSLLKVNEDGSINVGGVSIGSVSITADTGYLKSGDNLNLGSAWKGVGSVYITNSISVSTGSNVFINGGSIQTFNPIGVGSVLVTNTIDANTGSNVYVKAGSVIITNPSSIGSFSIYGVSGIVSVDNFGSKFYQGTSPWIVNGSINVNNYDVIGSLEYQKTIISGTPSIIVTNPATIGSFTNQNIIISGIPSIIGSVAISNSISVTVGSETYVKAGSVIITNPSEVGSIAVQAISGVINVATGSVVYQGTNPWIIAGSIASMPDINVATGSEQWIRGGSIQIYNPIGVGSVYMMYPAVHPVSEEHNDSIVALDVHAILSAKDTTGSYINIEATQGGNLKVAIEDWDSAIGSMMVLNRVAGSIVNMPSIIGSVNIDNFAIIGSLTTQNIAVSGTPNIIGSVYVSNMVGSNNYIPAGSVIITNRVAGSIVDMPSIVGSVNVNNWNDTVKVEAGSVIVTNRVAGSIVNLPSIIGSVNIDNAVLVGSIGVQTTSDQKMGSVVNYLSALNSLTQSTYDYIDLLYSGNVIGSVLYKTGGAGGTTVSTLVLAYSGANSVLKTVTRT